MGSANFYILATICNRLTNLIIDPAGGEICECGSIGNLAANGETGCYTNHISFGNTNLNKTFRKFFDKLVQFQRTQQVGCQCNDIGIAAGRFHNTISEAAAGIFIAGRLNIF